MHFPQSLGFFCLWGAIVRVHLRQSLQIFLQALTCKHIYSEIEFESGVIIAITPLNRWKKNMYTDGICRVEQNRAIKAPSLECKAQNPHEEGKSFSCCEVDCCPNYGGRRKETMFALMMQSFNTCTCLPACMLPYWSHFKEHRKRNKVTLFTDHVKWQCEYHRQARGITPLLLLASVTSRGGCQQAESTGTLYICVCVFVFVCVSVLTYATFGDKHQSQDAVNLAWHTGWKQGKS